MRALKFLVVRRRLNILPREESSFRSFDEASMLFDAESMLELLHCYRLLFDKIDDRCQATSLVDSVLECGNEGFAEAGWKRR